MLGRGVHVRATVDAVLAFRRAFLAIEGNDLKDFAILRGAQEEMWHKLFELQFAVNPAEVLEWMMAQGIEATIRAYGAEDPCLSPGGAVVHINARNGFHFLTSVSGFFLAHLLYRDELRGKGFYALDHEGLFRQNRNAVTSKNSGNCNTTPAIVSCRWPNCPAA